MQYKFAEFPTNVWQLVHIHSYLLNQSQSSGEADTVTSSRLGRAHTSLEEAHEENTTTLVSKIYSSLAMRC